MTPDDADKDRDDREVNLLLVRHTSHVLEDDFERIAALVEKREPRVHAYVLRDRPHRLARLRLARRPTMVFAAKPLQRFRPLRGAVFVPKSLPKSEECRRLEAGGFPVPRWKPLTRTSRPDLSDLGPYVVMKPDLGVSGAEVKIVRSGRATWKPQKVDSLDQTRDADLIGQEFVYTGRWPVSWRVVTLFGRAITSLRIESAHERAPLEERYGFRDGGGGRSIVASSKGCEVKPAIDDEIVALAQRAHAAFGEYGILGFDLIREVPTGRLFILEANTLGHMWLFCSKAGLRIRRETGEDLRDQMGGLPLAAEVLADRARALAT